jgi:hypothetical protein
MEEIREFLLESIKVNDLVMLSILDKPEPQEFTARILKIYSRKHGMESFSVNEVINFVGLPTTWGSEQLNVGGVALVFIKYLDTSKRFYEMFWRGHLWLEEIEGKTHAVYQEKELWNKDYFPEELKLYARQDPKRSYATAIQFDALERYIVNLIAK